MDTKLRNRNIKLAFLVLLFTFGISGIFVLATNSSNLLDDYFETEEFRSEYNQFIDYLFLYELNEMSSEEAKEAITVTVEEIDEHRYQYGDLLSQKATIRNQYAGLIEEAEAAGDKEVAEAYKKERDEKIEDISQNFKSDEHVEKKVRAEKEKEIDQYFRDLQTNRSDYLRYSEAFTYYLKDRDSSKVYTNLNLAGNESPKDHLNKKNMIFIRTYPAGDQGYLSAQYQYGYSGEQETVSQIVTTPRLFEGQVAVSKMESSPSYIMNMYEDFQKRKVLLLIYIGASLAALAGSVLLGRKEIQALALNDKWAGLYLGLPIDLRVLLFGVTMFGGIISFLLINDQFYYFSYSQLADLLIGLLIATLFMVAFILQVKMIAVQWGDRKKLKEDWKGSYVFRMVTGIRNAFLVRSTGIQLLILLSGIFLFGLSAGLVFVDPFFLLVFGFLFLAAIFPAAVLIRRTGYFNKILQNTNELAAGRMGSDLPVKKRSALGTLAGNINVLKHGVKKSQNEQAKSERLKTELITNVSHDLRTPLTSIITYTELLKAPGVNEADREAYLEIIDRKSKRLKVLIDDLFEASKMASGSVELVRERIDLVQLLQQALAEHSEKMDQNSLQFRVSAPEEPVYSMVDGQKLWRVFDNLIGNILKYSLENTRVYISLKPNGNNAVITFKNVTKYELSESVDELFERFKRGDQSRNTEGSGLGLAIAKSIVDLHDGELDIEVDGDLFKVIVTLETV
ncbi:GHKL domain-containing protein [Mesobacillus foraminis]|uniref:sensor histidine kinase n=1 Tax=Mesobacillus foraminis TaxID=279826 RepID=UPI001BE80055|nr:HAMP domain-containing sensor histidine kinase [Mesobacillus foraminis]MBT2756531.1 GHKL domain-containing protein [Mesobacillus foraminis]